MLSKKEIICPNNLLKIAKNKGPVKAVIVNAGKKVAIESTSQAVKANLIVDDAQKHGHDLKKCHAYSDSFSDVPMLSVVGHAFCINPDKKLSRLANAYRWPILDISRQPPASHRKDKK